MSDFGTPPVIPTDIQPYNSYLTDPQWQLKFSIIWSSALGFFILLSVPRILRAVRIRRGLYDFKNWVGIRESRQYLRDYDLILDTGELVKHEHPWARWTAVRYLDDILRVLNAFFCLTIPVVGVNVGQVTLLIAYTATLFVCIVQDSILSENPNRAGFLSLAQLPVVFLFSSKNSVISFLLGPGVGYEKLNFLHRWSGRVMFLSALLHGSLWMKIQLVNGLAILEQGKLVTGIVALSSLTLIVLSSLRPARIFIYQVFVSLHLVFAAAFYVAILYHTPYAVPWVYIPLAIYGLDIFLRMLRYRFSDAVLVPVEDQMTLVHVPHVTSGWVAGQHVRLHILFSGRVFESHPFTIFSATPDISCISFMPPGLSLGVKTAGDWTKALNKYANEMVKMIEESPSQNVDPFIEVVTSPVGTQRPPVEVPIQVLIDGPYGGCSVDLGDYETVLLLSGGSGITFTLGLLDDIVGRCLRMGRKNGEKTKRIEFSWCIGSFGQLDWFSSALMDIATIAASSATSSSPVYLHMSIYAKCVCNPDAIPRIPNCDVIEGRASVYHTLQHLINPPKEDTLDTKGRIVTPSRSKESESSTEIFVVDEEADLSSSVSQKLPWIKPGGGVAVCASGPAGLSTQAANAVSRVQLSKRGRELGGIALHTEVFAL